MQGESNRREQGIGEVRGQNRGPKSAVAWSPPPPTSQSSPNTHTYTSNQLKMLFCSLSCLFQAEVLQNDKNQTSGMASVFQLRPDYSGGERSEGGMCPAWLSPMNAHSWPRRGRSRKELLMSGLALAPHPEWEVDNSRPLCIQSTLNYPRADSPLRGSPILPLSSLQLSALWPFPAHQSHSQREGGQVEEGWGCKIQISHFMAVP